MKNYALIGRRLSHSYSQRYFEELFSRLGLTDYSYTLHEMESLDSLHQWVADEQINGFNVTNPYKQAVIPLLDELSPEAHAIGAVNCVVVNDGRLIGHNTDAPAFQQTLEHILPTISTAFILGTGGAARAVAHALGQLGIPYTFVSRTPENHENAIGYPKLSTFNFQYSTLIVNATPIGTYPDIDATPLDITHAFKHSNINAFVYDLVYNPSPTLLMRQAAALGAKTKDGMEMLHLQADLSWHLWK